MGALNKACSTVKFLSETLLAATPAATATVAHAGIQLSRALDASTLKNQLKDTFSYTSSTCNIGIMTFASFNFFTTLISTGTWNQLGSAQRAGIITLATLGFAAEVASMIEIGTEHITLTAGILASVGAFTLFSTKTLAGMCTSGPAEAAEKTVLLGLA
jgi:hypothetical protein